MLLTVGFFVCGFQVVFVGVHLPAYLADRGMPAHVAVTALAETFKILGDPTRIKIAFALSLEELCVCDIANLFGVSQSAVSHSLRTLRQLKLVKFRKEGKIAYYSLDDEHISDLLKIGLGRVEENALKIR